MSKVKFSISVEESLRDKLEEMGKKQNRTISNLVETFLIEHFDGKQDEKQSEKPE